MRPNRLLMVAVVAAMAASAHAEQTPAGPDKNGFDAATTSAIQKVVTAQLDAFEHENAEVAESFAAPAIQERFPKPDEFLGMVKEHYAALIHPRSTTFGEIAASPHGPLQKMTVVASDGTVWTAIYSFEQVDGAWRITACGLEKAEGQQDI